MLFFLQAKTVQPKPGTEEKGQIVQTETPVHHSNVMHWSKEQKVRSRIRQQCVPTCHTRLLNIVIALDEASLAEEPCRSALQHVSVLIWLRCLLLTSSLYVSPYQLCKYAQPLHKLLNE